MENLFDQTKSSVVNFKLDYCCWLAPVRLGVMFTGYFNIFVALISLIATANESFPPTIVAVMKKILDDEEPPKLMPIVAYSTELGFNVLLLCAIYRRDAVLLRTFLRYCLVVVVLSLLVYSTVIAGIDVLVQLAIIASILFQCYVFLLVRSAIVEIKLEKKKYELPTLVMSSLVQDKSNTVDFDNGDGNGKPDDTAKSSEVKIVLDVPKNGNTKDESQKDKNDKKDKEGKKDKDAKKEKEVKKDKDSKKEKEAKKDKESKKDKDTKKDKEAKKDKEVKFNADDKTEDKAQSSVTVDSKDIIEIKLKPIDENPTK